MSDGMKQIGRLVFREEGTLWVAYYALNETMDGALFLGSVRMAAVFGKPEQKRRFMDLMRGFVSDIFEEESGARPVWNEPVPGPAHERGGSA